MSDPGYGSSTTILQSAQRSLEALLAPYVSTISQRPPRLAESQVRQISDALNRIGKESWSKVPRIYAVLHMTQSVHILDAFISNGVSDLWFPFTHKTLPECLRSPSTRFHFLELQDLVLTKALDLEREDGSHRHFSKTDELPLIKLEELGKGGFGFVDRVQSTITYKEYARKLIPRGKTFKKNAEVLKDFERELGHLKRLRHLHIVELIGSYTDTKFVGILMAPVADYNLKDFMARDLLPQGDRSFLRTFYGCLASALCYLHEQKVRHKDIKPQNVLVKGHQVFLTDFGISLDWTDLGQSTTTGITIKTPRYCAPEVADHMPRNTSADIWSLGCIYLEIWSVLMGQSISALLEYLETHGSKSTCYYLNPISVATWCDTLSQNATTDDETPPLSWIRGTLEIDQEHRWTAQKLVDQISEANEDSDLRFAFSGTCCIDEDGSTDSHMSSKRSSRYLDETGVSSLEAYFPKSSDHDLPEQVADLQDPASSNLTIRPSSLVEVAEQTPIPTPLTNSIANGDVLSIPTVYGLGIRTDDTILSPDLSVLLPPVGEAECIVPSSQTLKPESLRASNVLGTGGERDAGIDITLPALSGLSDNELPEDDKLTENPLATADVFAVIPVEGMSNQELRQDTKLPEAEVKVLSSKEVQELTTEPQGAAGAVSAATDQLMTESASRIEEQIFSSSADGEDVGDMSSTSELHANNALSPHAAAQSSTDRVSISAVVVDDKLCADETAFGTFPGSPEAIEATIEQAVAMPISVFSTHQEKGIKLINEVGKDDGSFVPQSRDLETLHVFSMSDSALPAARAEISDNAQNFDQGSETNDIRRTKSAASVTPEQTWALWEQKRLLTRAAHRRGLSVDEYQALQQRTSDHLNSSGDKQILQVQCDGESYPQDSNEPTVTVTAAEHDPSGETHVQPAVDNTVDQQLPRSSKPIFERREREMEALSPQAVNHTGRISNITQAITNTTPTRSKSPTSPSFNTRFNSPPQRSPSTDKSPGGFFGMLKSKMLPSDRNTRQVPTITKPILHLSPEMTGDVFMHEQPRKSNDNNLRPQDVRFGQGSRPVSPQPVSPSYVKSLSPTLSPTSPPLRSLPSPKPQPAHTANIAESESASASLYDVLMQRSWCHKCREPLSSNSVRALGASWHVNCFTCHDCNKEIASNFFTWNTITGDAPHVALCEMDYFRRLDLLCHTCSKALRGSYLTASGHKYHVDHFGCTICGFKFTADERYFEVKGMQLCHYHYVTEVAEMCPSCHTAVTDRYVERTNAGTTEKWHLKCDQLDKRFGSTPPPFIPLLYTRRAEPDGRNSSPSDTDRQALKDYENIMETEISRIWMASWTFVDLFQQHASSMFIYAGRPGEKENVQRLSLMTANMLLLLNALNTLANTLFHSLQIKETQYSTTARALSQTFMDLMDLIRPELSTDSRFWTRKKDALAATTTHYLTMLVQAGLSISVTLNKESSRTHQDLKVSFIDDLERFHSHTRKQSLPWTDKITLLEYISDHAHRCPICRRRIFLSHSEVELGPVVWHFDCLMCSKCQTTHKTHGFALTSKRTRMVEAGATTVDCSKCGCVLPHINPAITEVAQYRHRLLVRLHQVVDKYTRVKEIW